MMRRFTPTLFIVLCNLTAFAAVLLFHLAADTPIHFINRWIMPGVDYRDFYQASLRLLHGESPYVVARYVTPPLFAFVNLPLALLDFGTARLIFTALALFTVLVSYNLIHQALHDPNDANDEWRHVFGIVAILFSYPLYFLFERGNVDGFVLLGIAALGVALTQWQAVALHTVTGNIAAYYIPGIGLLLTMVGISLHALLKWRGGHAGRA